MAASPPRFPATIPFGELLGLELLVFEDGIAEVACSLRPELCNSIGNAHGGVAMAMLDVAMVHAARSPAAGETAPRPMCVTLEMKTSFLRPGLGRLVARARVLQRSASLAFCEAALFDAAEVLTAHATGSFKYLRTA
jgi:uncharacterized protein (TIGR00369 family)